MMQPAGFRWTIPNTLSIFRIACTPVMVLLAVLHIETGFVVVFVLAQISDILDGQLARALKQESDIGVLLDSYGDLGSYIAGFTGLIIFHREIFHPPYAPWILTFAALYLFNLVLGRLKWGRWVTGLHLYSSKVTGYLQGTFLVLLFAWKLIPVAFYIMISAGILSLAECILINLAASRPVLNAKGLYWAIKEGRLK